MPCTAAMAGCGRFDDLLHHRTAHRHDVAKVSAPSIRVAAAACEFLEIVTGAESRAICCQHDCPNCSVCRNVGQRGGQRGQHFLGETVARLRAIENEDGNILVTLVQERGSLGRHVGFWNIHGHFQGQFRSNLNPKPSLRKATKRAPRLYGKA